MKTQPLKLLLLLALPAAADPQIEICIASAYCPPPYHACSCPPAVAPAMSTPMMLLTAALLLAIARKSYTR